MAHRSTSRFVTSLWTCLLAGSLLLMNCVLVRVEAAKKPDAAPSIRPGDDFYGYANGEWLAQVSLPAGQHTYDNRIMMAEKTRERVRGLMQEAATGHAPSGSVAQKVGDFYSSFTNEASIEGKGFTPLAEEMTRISAIANRSMLAAYLGTTLTREVDGLTANNDHVFGLWANQGFEDAEHNLPHLWQGGLGLTDSGRYLDSSAQAAELRVNTYITYDEDSRFYFICCHRFFLPEKDNGNLYLSCPNDR